jgi:hypothetical protein
MVLGTSVAGVTLEGATVAALVVAGVTEEAGATIVAGALEAGSTALVGLTVGRADDEGDP